LTGGLAFVVGGIILSSAGVDPIHAYQIMIKGAFGSVRALADTLVKTTSLLILGLAVSVAFKCKIWNIGAEGQLYFGALGGLLAGLSFIGAVPILAPIAVIITGFVFGSLFSMVPAALKVKLGVNEVIVTVLLNFVALLFISYLLHGPLKAPGFLSYSPNIFPQSELPILLPNTRLSVGILIAAGSAIGVYLLMSKTKIGFEIRSVGANIKAARYVGMNVGKSILITMGISGGLAGVAGAILIAGVQHRLIEGISPGYGFIAVIVALLGKQSPVGVTIVAFFFSALLAGSEVMYRTLGVPVALAQTLQALVLVFVLIGELFLRWQPKWRKG
jgi:simple sugar transport system permease protein